MQIITQRQDPDWHNCLLVCVLLQDLVRRMLTLPVEARITVDEVSDGCVIALRDTANVVVFVVVDRRWRTVSLLSAAVIR